jgi:hypothetical protein
MQRTGSAGNYADIWSNNSYLALGSDASSADLVIKSNKVGIGCNDPAAKLHIKGTPSGSTSVLKIVDSGDVDGNLGMIALKGNTDAYGFDTGLDPVTGDLVWRRIINNSSGEALRIMRVTGALVTSANMGIGTGAATPTGVLELQTAAAAQITLSNSCTSLCGGHCVGLVAFKSYDSNATRLKHNDHRREKCNY